MAIALEQLPTIRGSYRQNVQMANITWFRVGGQAEILFRPADINDLCHFLRHKPDGIPVYVLGVGSNILVRDGGIEGVVIRLGRGFAGISVQGHKVVAGAGALDFNVAMVAACHGIAGLEFLSGIPGTIGGALAMNGGAYGRDVAQRLLYAHAVDERGDIHKLTVADIGYVYRGHTLPESMIFTEAVFEGCPGKAEDIEAHMAVIARNREAAQPLKSRTGGSTFKNPPGHHAWKLIDQAGCRGLTFGGAKVSEKHCNFFVNTGTATAADIEALGEQVKRRVKEQCGIDLQWEIQMIGKTSCYNPKTQ